MPALDTASIRAIPRGHKTWEPHYDALPPKQPHLALLPRWIWLGVVPQLTIWIAFTVCVGGLFGALGFLAAGLKARWRSA